MNTLTRKIGVALTAVLLATTAAAPMASARPWQGEQRQQVRHSEPQRRVDLRGGHRDHDNGAGLALGLGLAALAGVAIWNASQAPVYQPAYPAYPQPSYGQPYYAPTYAQPYYGQPGGYYVR